MRTQEDIIRYFDECEFQYRRHWNLDESLAMHYGYWDETTKSFPQSLSRLNSVMARQVQLKEDEHILDAGSGVGGSAIYLAQEYGCKVTGITLSDIQVRRSRENAIKKKIDALVHFDRRDLLDTGYKDQSFDVIWAIESVCYAHSKTEFFKEAYRLLRPAGRIIVADFFQTKDPKYEADQQSLERLYRGWCVPSFAIVEPFKEQMKKLGFKDTISINVTQNIYRSAERLYRKSFWGILGAHLQYALGVTSKVPLENARAAYWQFKTLQRRLWNYHIVSARK